MLTILLIVVIVLALGGLPTWGYHQYGYTPSGILVAVVVIILVLYVLGYRL